MSTLSVRRPLSVVAVLAMVAAMLFAVVGTASATAGDLATLSACPASANIPDAGFTDVVSGDAYNDAVNCVKYYGVTQGTTATTYSPGDSITRSQMALFLTRNAVASGVTLAAAPADAGFTDIGDLPADRQLAINQLAALGIVTGTTATTYSPDDAVTREVMAVWMVEFLEDSILGPGGSTDPNATANLTGAPFTDISGVTFAAHQAINEVYNLGITLGKTATTYAPNDAVTRGQMALFMTRLMAHTNARPAGVSIQADAVTGFGALTPDLYVSVRGADFSASSFALLDVFEHDSGQLVPAVPFIADGTCDITAMTAIGGGTECSIDAAVAADVNGNWDFANATTVTEGGADTFVAWTGALAATYDNDTTASASVVVSSTMDGDHYRVSNTIPAQVKDQDGIDAAPDTPWVKYGTDVTITVQLTDALAGSAVAKSAVDVVFTNVWAYNGNSGTTATTVTTDSTGKATFTVNRADPSAIVDNSGDTDAITVSVAGVTKETSSVDLVTIYWDDDAGVAASVVGSTGTSYVVQSDGLTNTAMATVYDKYGATVSGANVGFTSTNNSGTPDDEIQTLTFADQTWAVNDTMTITFDGYTTDTITATNVVGAGAGSTALAIADALEALPNVNDVTVGSDCVAGGCEAADVVTIEFLDPGNMDVAEVVVASIAYAGANGTVAVATTAAGTTGGAAGIGGYTVNATTNSSGVASLGYTWDWDSTTENGIETITVDAGNSITDTNTFVWANTAVDADVAAGTLPTVIDVASDKVVIVEAGVYKIYTYDSNDQFNIGVAGATPATLAEFEAALVAAPAGDSLEVVAYNVGGVSVFSLTEA